MTRPVRVSIAGLMGVILWMSLGLAALLHPTPMWAGLLFYLAAGLFSLGVVGVVCGRVDDRAWWLGFAGFGWGYLILSFWWDTWLPSPPFASLLFDLRRNVLAPASGQRPYDNFNSYRQISQCLESLLYAVLGGLLAHGLFGRPATITTATADASRQESRLSWRRWRRLGVAVVAVTMITACVLARSRSVPGLWAGTMIIFTWGTLGFTAILAFCRQGRRRAASLGATLFGAGYMLLVAGQPVAMVTNVRNEPWPRFATSRLLNTIRPWIPTVVSEFPANSDGIAFANARILRSLDKTVSLEFPEEIPLEDFLASVAKELRFPDGSEVAIYFDPVALEEAEKTVKSPVRINLKRVPLRTGLELALSQLGLHYAVKGGLIAVDSEGPYDDATVELSDPFLVVGQCLLALLAAGIGSVLGTYAYDPKSEQSR